MTAYNVLLLAIAAQFTSIVYLLGLYSQAVERIDKLTISAQQKKRQSTPLAPAFPQAAHMPVSTAKTYHKF